jgi:hypothetical protein
MLKTSKFNLMLCALALGVGAQFATEAQALPINACFRACSAERVACLRNGGGDWCFDDFSACIAECP